jgi:hypothetical protein
MNAGGQTCGTQSQSLLSRRAQRPIRVKKTPKRYLLHRREAGPRGPDFDEPTYPANGI